MAASQSPGFRIKRMEMPGKRVVAMESGSVIE
jgi:hypothetical protein